MVNGINRFRVYVFMVRDLYVCAHHPVSSGPRVRREHLRSPQPRLLFLPCPSRWWAVCEGRGVCTEGPWGRGRVTPPQVQHWLPAPLHAEPEGWGTQGVPRGTGPWPEEAPHRSRSRTPGQPECRVHCGEGPGTAVDAPLQEGHGNLNLAGIGGPGDPLSRPVPGRPCGLSSCTLWAPCRCWVWALRWPRVEDHFVSTGNLL